MSRAPRPPSSLSPINLARHDGECLLSASEAMLKGLLEAEAEIALVAGPPQGAFSAFFDLAGGSPALRAGSGAPGSESRAALLLRQHNMRLVETPDAGRGLALAMHAARAGRAAFALLPNDQLDQTIALISQAATEPLDRGGALCLVLEDSPKQAPASCPRRAVQRLNLTCIEPTDVGQLRDSMEHALRLSRAGRGPAAVIVHTSILRSADTLQLRPNRVQESVDAMLARRKRSRPPSVRWTDAAGPLRAARRLEMNRFRAVPSPGERVAVGFLTVGPADAALQHLTTVLGLHGRVPVLQLGLVHPIDESAVGRLLARCQQVIVLEPRPGAIETAVLGVAEVMRRKGEQPATIWGRAIPPDQAGGGGGGSGVAEQFITSDDDLHPSILVRKIAHLLHAIRPTIQVASQLMPDPPAATVAVLPRDAQIGSSAALALIKRILSDVDQWLRERAPLAERGIAPTALAIDGAEATGVKDRVVNVETWDHRRFQRDGIAALVQAAREGQPWIFLACETASEPVRDLERLARGAIPAESADRVSLEVANLADRIALRDLIREAALVDRMTVIIVRDGPPTQYDVAAIDQSLAEIDRLGFEPLQRLVRSADEVCAIRPAVGDGDAERRLEHEPSALASQFTVDEVSSRAGPAPRLRVRPLIEEVDVVRTRPPGGPVGSWRGEPSAKLPTPGPVHARQAQWRVHLAGFRRDGPGLAALVLSDAGRFMGYHVRSTHDPAAIGPGRRAWAQVLFTHPRGDEAAIPLTAVIPYGEADLLLGLDARETLRAIGPDPALRVAFAEHTYAVANVGWFGDESGGGSEASAATREQIHAALPTVTRADARLIDDFSGACRTWFHTDRVCDLTLLGAAFQLGLVPVSQESIEAAVNQAESGDRGCGRSRESFEFGRRLAVDQRLFQRPKDEREEDVNRLARRMVLSLSRGGWGGGARARNFSGLLQASLKAMPSLAETDPGRAARRDFVVACHRCRIWGGLEYARQYADLITRLYQVDRGETGRALTRSAVLPLADAMLIRDPVFIASMASSSEQRRRTRIRMNVKLARGDRVERRYLTRLELIVARRRLRADVRTSDWPARAASLLGRLVPNRLRGTRRERELRDYLIDLVRRAIEGAAADFERWLEPMSRLHHQAVEDRLRGMALAELKMLVGNG